MAPGSKPVLRLVCVASPGGSQGKTQVSAGLCAALRSLGLKTQAFVLGPAQFSAGSSPCQLLEEATGHAVHCLDPWLFGASGSSDKLLQYIYKHAAGTADIAVLDGMKGLYDEPPGLCGCCTATTAKDIKASCVLVLDGCCSVGSALALLKGHLELDKQLHVPCVVLNRADTAGLNAASMQAAVRSAGLDTRVLGCIPKAGWAPGATAEERCSQLAALVKRHIDLEGLLQACPARELRAAAPDTPGVAPPAQHHSFSKHFSHLPSLGRKGSHGGSQGGAAPPPMQQLLLKQPGADGELGLLGQPVVVAVAVDAVFGPSFPGNIVALEAAGAHVVRFSPLSDTQLPDNTAGIYLGGSASTLRTHGAALASNTAMRAALAAFCAAGGVVLAEAAGLAYLSQSLTPHPDVGMVWPMAGVFPFRGFLAPSDRAPEEGYVECDVLPSASHLLSLAGPHSSHSAGGSGHSSSAATGGMASSSGSYMTASHPNSAGGTPKGSVNNHNSFHNHLSSSSPTLRGYLHSEIELVEEVRHSMGGRLGQPTQPYASTPGAAPAPANAAPYLSAFRASVPSTGLFTGPMSTSGGAGEGRAGSFAAASANQHPASWLTGYVKANVLASAVHLHFGAHPDVAHAWVAACARVDAVAVGRAAAAAASMHQHKAVPHPHSHLMPPSALGAAAAAGALGPGSVDGAWCSGSLACSPPPDAKHMGAVSGYASPPGALSRCTSGLDRQATNGSSTSGLASCAAAGFSNGIGTLGGGRVHTSAHQLSSMGCVDGPASYTAGHSSGSFAGYVGAAGEEACAQLQGNSQPAPGLQRSPASHLSDLDLPRHLASYGTGAGAAGTGTAVAGGVGARYARASADFPVQQPLAHISPRGMQPATFAEGVRRRLALSARSSIDDLLSLAPQAPNRPAAAATAPSLHPSMPHLMLPSTRDSNPGAASSHAASGLGYGLYGVAPVTVPDPRIGGHRRHGSTLHQAAGQLAGVDEDDVTAGGGYHSKHASDALDYEHSVHGLSQSSLMAPAEHPMGLPPLYGRTHNKLIGLACPLKPPGAAAACSQASCASSTSVAGPGSKSGNCSASEVLCTGACGCKADMLASATTAMSVGVLSRSSSSKSIQHAASSSLVGGSSMGGASFGHGSFAGAHPHAMPGVAHSDAIVSMCPGATEALVAMGLGGRLVGVSEGCDWPPEIKGTRALVVRSRVPLLAGATCSGQVVRPNTPEWAAAAAQLAAEGISQLLVDEDLLREENPGLVVLPALEGLGRPEQLALQRALQRTVLSGSGAARGALRCMVLQHACRTLADVLDSMLQLGDAAAAPQAAGVLADRLRARLRRAAGASATAFATAAAVPNAGLGHAPWRPRVLVLTSLQPGAMMRAGRWVPEMIGLAGAVPAAPPTPTAQSHPSTSQSSSSTATPSGTPPTHAAAGGPFSNQAQMYTALEPGDQDVPITWDEVRAAAPDVLVVADQGGAALSVVGSVAQMPGWWSLRAVHTGHVYLLESGYLTRPGPRLIEGVEMLTRITLAAAWLTEAAGSKAVPRAPPGAALKLSLSGGQRCRPSLVPNYLVPWQ